MWTKAVYRTTWTREIMACMLPMGEKIAAVSGIWNGGKYMIIFVLHYQKLQNIGSCFDQMTIKGLAGNDFA